MFGLFSASERETKEAFDLGYKTGLQQGIQDGMAKNFERSAELTESEYKEAIEFLMSRGLEMCCYDVMRGGFRIRKHIREDFPFEDL